jgi:hypothetical protein
MLERDYSDNVDPVVHTRDDSKALVCSLTSQVQLLLTTICSVAMMKSTMAEIGVCYYSFPFLHFNIYHRL